jgi:hypothetical protein
VDFLAEVEEVVEVLFDMYALFAIIDIRVENVLGVALK